MSYILDALRRADSDRERGAVPKLFAQPLPRVSIEPEAALLGWPWAWVVAGVVLAAVLGVVAWRLAAPAVPSAIAESPTAPAPPVAPALPPVTTAAESNPSPPPVKPTVAEVARQARKPPAAVMAATPRATAAPEPAASAAESRIYARNELPGEVQRELPTLAIGGASYSESPANRMLIINGQVFHEGDKLTPDLVLEQIKLKAAVLRYKGYRYGVSY